MIRFEITECKRRDGTSSFRAEKVRPGAPGTWYRLWGDERSERRYGVYASGYALPFQGEVHATLEDAHKACHAHVEMLRQERSKEVVARVVTVLELPE